MSAAFTILGAGVCGLAIASELSARGASVQVLDPKGAPGQHACSWWAGGMLAPECEGVIAEPEITRQGRKAANWWQANRATVIRNGTLVVALGRDHAELKSFARRAPSAEWLDRNAITALEPHLAEQFATALLLPTEAHLDPRNALSSLYDGLRMKGVRFDDKLDGQIIDCRGLAASDTLSDLRGVTGEMMIIKCPDIRLQRPIRLLHPRFPLYVVPRGDGVFMLGATQLESSRRRGATLRSISELINAAYALHPAFGEAQLLETGVDARPAFPDNQPRIRRIEDRIYVNGLFRHGFLLAPSLAQMTADLLLKQHHPEVWYETDR